MAGKTRRLPGAGSARITHQECRSLEQQHLVGLDDLGEVAQVGFQLLHVGDQLIDDAGPGLSVGESGGWSHSKF